MEDKKERKIMFRKFYILAIALVCAFASLGAYTWADRLGDPILEGTPYVVESDNLADMEASYQYTLNDNEGIALIYEYADLKSQVWDNESPTFNLLLGGTLKVSSSNGGQFSGEYSDKIIFNTENDGLTYLVLNLPNGEYEMNFLPYYEAYIVTLPPTTESQTFTQGIFTTLAEIAASFVALLVSLFSSVVNIFYSGGQLTIIGILSLISVAGGLVMWGFKYIRRLIKIRTKK